MLRCLITGGAGFIGSHLVEKLLEQGHEVKVIDNFVVGKTKNLPMGHPNLQVHLMDILEKSGSLFQGIDIVYHLAALTRPQESILDPFNTNKVNVDGTLRVLLNCRDAKVKRLVFISTTGIYGQAEHLPTSEIEPAKPMSPYTLSKLIGEQYCQLFSMLYEREINIIRPFNVYGIRQSPNGGYAAAVPKFIDMLSKGERPFITGDGRQARDFVYVDDVVDLIIKAGESKKFGEVFNAGSGVSTSINRLYEIVSSVMGKSVRPKYVKPVFEPRKTLGDIAKGKRVLNWEPKVSLERGIKLTVKGTLNEQRY